MRTLEQIQALLDDRFADLSYRHVAEWKAAAPHRLAIGCLPVFAPREVLWAAGALPVFVRGAGDRLETVRGDAFYQSYICHLPRSTLELGLDGHLGALDGMIFPNTCDVIRNLSGVWQDVFPQVLVRFLDPPQSDDRPSAARYARHELGRLYRDLCARSGREPTAQALTDAIADYGVARRAAATLADARIRAPWLHPVDDVYLLRRAGDAMPPRDWAALVDDYLAAAATRGTRAEDRIRVVIAGAFCEQPPVALLRAAEKAGCYVIDDDLTLGLDAIGPEPSMADGADPLDALVRASISVTRSCAVRYDDDNRAGEKLVERVRAFGADGVVFAAPSFCDPALLEQPRLTRALDAAQIPYTSFKYAESSGQFQAIREQTGTFADSVRLWGHA